MTAARNCRTLLASPIGTPPTGTTLPKHGWEIPSQWKTEVATL
jgi:hypothetical protein